MLSMQGGQAPYPANPGLPYPENPPPSYDSTQAPASSYPPAGQPGPPQQYGGTGQTVLPPAGAGQPQTVVYGQPTQQIITHHVVQHFGDAPVLTQCPKCHNQVTTVVSHEPGSQAWMFFILMCIFWYVLCINVDSMTI